MTHVVMPEGASAAGEAFELLSSRYLCRYNGLEHVSAPFYTRLQRGKWVQFDGVFARDGGAKLVLEAKFHDAPVSLATPGIAARFLYAKEAQASGIILASRRGFERDVLRVKSPIEKVFLSWPGMHRRIAASRDTLLTATLDVVTAVPGGYESASGKRLLIGADDALRGTDEGLAFLPAAVERWLRRLPAATRDLRIPHGRPARLTGPMDIEQAWLIEDSLRGFAPCDPRLLVDALAVIGSGPATLVEVWKALWTRGFRGRRTAAKNALDNLSVIGAAVKFRTEKGLFYEAISPVRHGVGETLRLAVEAWPGYEFFIESCPAGLSDKHAISAALSAHFGLYYPYARSLYNPAKVSGLLSIRSYLSGTSTASPS